MSPYRSLFVLFGFLGAAAAYFVSFRQLKSCLPPAEGFGLNSEISSF